MTTLRIDILPQEAQREIKDFYDFLVSKYINKKSKEKSTQWKDDYLSVGTWEINEDEIKLKDWKIEKF